MVSVFAGQEPTLPPPTLTPDCRFTFRPDGQLSLTHNEKLGLSRLQVLPLYSKPDEAQPHQQDVQAFLPIEGRARESGSADQRA